MADHPLKIGLGTAQFGLDYGITNRSGMMSDKDLSYILDNAFKAGIDLLDTAQAYGISEKRLGSYLVKSDLDYHIMTKVGLPTDQQLNSHEIREQICSSFERIGRSQLQAVLVHNISDLRTSRGDDLWQVLLELKKEEKLCQIGVSVYDGSDIDLVLKMDGVDLVQLPFNIADRRLEKSGHIEKIKENNIEIHGRSIFLQGLLLMETGSLPEYFSPLNEILGRLDALAHEHQVSRQAVILSVDMSFIDRHIIGVSTASEFDQLLHSIEESKKIGRLVLNDLPEIKPEFLDPRRWPEG